MRRSSFVKLADLQDQGLLGHSEKRFWTGGQIMCSYMKGEFLYMKGFFSYMKGDLTIKHRILVRFGFIRIICIKMTKQIMSVTPLYKGRILDYLHYH